MPENKTRTKEEELIEDSTQLFETFDDITKWQDRINSTAGDLLKILDQDVTEYDKSIEKLGEIITKSEEIHKKGGLCYSLTEKLLNKYSDWAYIEKINHMAYTRSIYADNGENGPDVEYHHSIIDMESDNFYLSRADIFDIMDDAEMGDYSANAINRFMKSVKMSLSGVMIYLLNRTIYIMTESKYATDESKKYGEFLKVRYMVMPDQIGTRDDWLERTGINSLSDYYRMLERSISFASSVLFGYSLEGNTAVTKQKLMNTKPIDDTKDKFGNIKNAEKKRA